MKQNARNLALVENNAVFENSNEPVKQGGKYSFAQYLRAIGQSLDAQNLASFELAYHSGVYVVRSVTAQKWSMKNIVSNLKVVFGGETKEPEDTASLQLEYSAEAILQLDEKGRTQRGHNHHAPDPFTIAEKLRSVGSFIDADPQRSLVSVTSQGKRLDIRYRSETGALRKNTRRMEHHFAAWKGLFQRRKNRIKLVK